MPNRFIPESFEKLLPALALAVLGGLVKVIKEGRQITIGRLFGCLLTAFFTGSITLLFIHDFPISLSCKAGVIAMSGFLGGEYLNVVSDGIIKLTKIRFKQEDDKK